MPALPKANQKKRVKLPKIAPVHEKQPASPSTLPTGAITLWIGASPVPSGWKACDGSDGTPSLSVNGEPTLIYIIKQ